MKFSSVIGHSGNTGILRKMLTRDEVPHAFIFSGPEGLGKRLCACALAAALNCVQPDENGDSCGACSSCRRLSEGNHPLIYFAGSLKNEPELRIESESGGVIIKNLDPEPAGAQKPKIKISIAQAREISRLACYKSYGTGKKVFIIDDIAEASRDAVNSLLKTLEEPPPATYFILITSREASLPQTIISRCRRIVFLPLNSAEMERFARERLTGAEADPYAMRSAAGVPGRLARCIEAGRVMPDRVPPEDFFELVTQWLSSGNNTERLLMLLEYEAARFRQEPSEKACRRVMDVEKALEDIKGNANPDLTVSNLFIKLGAVDL